MIQNIDGLDINGVLETLDNCDEWGKTEPGCCECGCRYENLELECIHALHMQAASLIRSLIARIDALEEKVTPRVLTLKELRKLTIGTVVWREYRYFDEEYGTMEVEMQPTLATLSGGPYDGRLTLTDGISMDCLENPSLLEPDPDGSQARYWSGKPSDEQREATPWL